MTKSTFFLILPSLLILLSLRFYTQTWLSNAVNHPKFPHLGVMAIKNHYCITMAVINLQVGWLPLVYKCYKQGSVAYMMYTFSFNHIMLLYMYLKKQERKSKYISNWQYTPSLSFAAVRYVSTCACICIFVWCMYRRAYFCLFTSFLHSPLTSHLIQSTTLMLAWKDKGNNRLCTFL